ncbi:MAG: ABC transporter substrate-binding protein, partial [Chloroflexota bacterium]
MIVGVRAIPDCFDLEQNRYGCPQEALQAHLQVYEPLLVHPVRADPGGYRCLDPTALEAALAEDCDLSADGTTCTLRLRRGALSWAGNELTAHDVKWSWERAFALDSWGARLARLAGVSSADHVRVVHNHTVQFRLDEQNARFPGVLADPLPAIHDLQEVRRHSPPTDPWSLAWLRSQGAGFGPFDLARMDGEAVFRSNDRYWQGQPRTKRLMMRAFPASARPAALIAGSIDLAPGLPDREAAALEGEPRVRVTSFPGQRQ